MENGASAFIIADGPQAHAVAIARLEIKQDEHERRISKLESVVWKVMLAALTGAIGGSAAAIALAKALL